MAPTSPAIRRAPKELQGFAKEYLEAAVEERSSPAHAVEVGGGVFGREVQNVEA